MSVLQISLSKKMYCGDFSLTNLFRVQLFHWLWPVVVKKRRFRSLFRCAVYLSISELYWFDCRQRKLLWDQKTGILHSQGASGLVNPILGKKLSTFSNVSGFFSAWPTSFIQFEFPNFLLRWHLAIKCCIAILETIGFSVTFDALVAHLLTHYRWTICFSFSCSLQFLTIVSIALVFDVVYTYTLADRKIYGTLKNWWIREF